MPHCSGYPHKDGEHFVLVGTGHTRICFEIIYHKGSLNANADALSRCTASNDTLCAATLVMPQYSMYELCKAQEADVVTSKRLEACSIPKPRLKGPEWNRPPLQCCGHSSRLLRVYFAGTILLLVPILPTSLLHKSLCRNHDASCAGHQGTEKNLHQICQEAYWVGMAEDVNRHSQACKKCQQSKLPSPQCAPLVNIPIGCPWQMIAANHMEK